MSSGTIPDLQIDRAYYNTLDVESFALMLKDPSYCYKFYWLEALVGLISEGKTNVLQKAYADLLSGMLSPYTPVNEYSAQ